MSRQSPGKSCQSIHLAHPALPSGLYWIDPDDASAVEPFRVYCDMSSHEGGWTLVLRAGLGRDITDPSNSADTFPFPAAPATPAPGSLEKISDAVINLIKTATGTEIGYWVTTPGSGTGLWGAEIFHRADCTFQMGQLSSEAKLTSCHQSTVVYGEPASWVNGGHWADDNGNYRWAFGHANENDHGTGGICHANGTGLGAHTTSHAPFHRGWCDTKACGGWSSFASPSQRPRAAGMVEALASDRRTASNAAGVLSFVAIGTGIDRRPGTVRQRSLAAATGVVDPSITAARAAAQALADR